MGKKDALLRSEQMPGHSPNPDIEVDTDVRLESEHGRMNKNAKF